MLNMNMAKVGSDEETIQTLRAYANFLEGEIAKLLKKYENMSLWERIVWAFTDK